MQIKWQVLIVLLELLCLHVGGEKLSCFIRVFPQQAIHQVHQDHVPQLPSAEFGLLGSTPVCEVQGFVLPKDASTLQDVKVFALQGHPEFSPELVTEIINAREAKGILTKEFAEESRANASLHDEGVSLGGVILSMLGV